MINIKVLGPGCNNCKNLEASARKVVEMLGLEANVEKITDHEEFLKYKLLATPGLVINDKLVSAGRIPSEQEIIDWLVA